MNDKIVRVAIPKSSEGLSILKEMLSSLVKSEVDFLVTPLAPKAFKALLKQSGYKNVRTRK